MKKLLILFLLILLLTNFVSAEKVIGKFTVSNSSENNATKQVEKEVIRLGVFDSLIKKIRALFVRIFENKDL